MRAFVLAMTFLLSMPVWAADIYLEPYVGYIEATVKSSYTSGTTVDTKNNAHGVGYGGKLGLSFMKVAIGGDFLGGSITMNGTNSTAQNFGAFINFNLVPMLNFHGTYYFSAQDKATSSGVTTTEKGNGLKVGFGFTIAPHVALNLDYLYTHFTTFSGLSGITDFDSTMSGGMVSLSVPFDL